MQKQVEIIVKGKVQGVYFRKSTKEIATLLGVRGFVKNLPNGSVIITALGNTTSIDKFIIWCKTGPPAASVSHISIKENENEQFQSFEIQ